MGNITGKKLKHTIHLEDLLYDGGDEGADLLITFIKDIQDQFSGHSKGGNVKTKYDGAPSLIVASDYHGETFVGTKGIFAGKICRTEEDIQNYHGHSEGLAHKLRIFLKYAKALGVPKDQFWQGDVLYSKDTLGKEVKDGETLVTFHPNTIVYAIPENDPLAHTVLNSEAGIAWHTRYKGPTIEDSQALFDVSKEELNDISEIVSLDANLPSLAGVVTFTKAETDALGKFVITIQKMVDKLKSDNFLNEVRDGLLSKYLNMFENYEIKTFESQLKKDPTDYLETFVEWVNARYQKELEKSGPRKSKRLTGEIEEITNYVNSNKDKLLLLFSVQKIILDFKKLVVSKLDKLGSLQSYIKKTNTPGLFTTGQEGFVISDVEGNIAKLVSRLDFSRNNFSKEILKGWDSARRQGGMTEEVNKQSVEDYIKGLGLEPREVTASKKPKVEDKPDFKSNVEPVEDLARKDKARQVLADLPEEEIYQSDIPSGDSRPLIVIEKEDHTISLNFKDKKGMSKRFSATDTEQMETWWMYFMKAKLDGRRYPSFEETQEGFPRCDQDWYNSFISGADAVYEYVQGDKEYYFSREGDQIPESSFPSVHKVINDLFNKKKAQLFLNKVGSSKDAWNPSDLYLCHKTYIQEFLQDWMELAASDETTLEDVNFLLSKALEEKDLIGISLKKLSDPDMPHVDQSKEISKEIFNCNLLSFKGSPFLISESPSNNKGESPSFKITLTGKKTLEVNGAFRFFGKTDIESKYCGKMQMEMAPKKGKAQLGKLPAFSLGNIYFEEEGLPPVPEKDEFRNYLATLTDEEMNNRLADYAGNIEEVLGEKTNIRKTDVVNYLNKLREIRKTEPKITQDFVKAGFTLRGLYLGNFFATLIKNGKFSEVFSDMLKRTAKMHDVNAPYVKLS